MLLALLVLYFLPQAVAQGVSLIERGDLGNGVMTLFVPIGMALMSAFTVGLRWLLSWSDRDAVRELLDGLFRDVRR